MTAYVFPGQGAQFSGMGQDLFNQSDMAKDLFALTDKTLGFSLSQIMFNGTDVDLKATKVTQPAVFVHSVIQYLVSAPTDAAMVAGHSLGEFSALVAAGALSFEDGLKLVCQRALAMQAACEAQPSTMAAVLGLEDAVVESICAEVNASKPSDITSQWVVVPANYNCPGQLVISGSVEAIDAACVALKAAGAKRALKLPVGGAFHSPLMQPAAQKLEEAIMATTFSTPKCAIYQNVDALPSKDVAIIKQKLIAQLTAPVRFTQLVTNMVADGATHFVESGPGAVLQGLVKKISPSATTAALQ